MIHQPVPWLPCTKLSARLSLMTVAVLAMPLLACAQEGPPQARAPAQPAILKDVGIDQKIGVQIPTDLAFKDDEGKQVLLGDYFGRRPLILVFVYYKCPMLCTMVLNDLTKSLNGMNLTAGKDFDILTVSFDPHETPQLAASKKRQYLRAYRRTEAQAGWHFLTGSQDSIDKLTSAAGFHYTWDPKYQVYAHASGLMILTPDGKIARYFFGIDYVPADLRLSLEEASKGTIGSPVDSILLYCFQYDPHTGRYGLVISRALQIGGALTLLIIGGGIFLMLRSERRSHRNGRLAMTGQHVQAN